MRIISSGGSVRRCSPSGVRRGPDLDEWTPQGRFPIWLPLSPLSHLLPFSRYRCSAAPRWLKVSVPQWLYSPRSVSYLSSTEFSIVSLTVFDVWAFIVFSKGSLLRTPPSSWVRDPHLTQCCTCPTFLPGFISMPSTVLQLWACIAFSGGISPTRSLHFGVETPT